MTAALPVAFDELVDQLGRLPGVGPRSSKRLAFHLLAAPETDTRRLAEAITRARECVTRCPTCFGYGENGADCALCADTTRDVQMLCVVEGVSDIAAVQRTGDYRGRFHVLGGAYSPIDGIGEEHLRIAELVDRIAADGVVEVIVATNPTIEGENTAAILSRRLTGCGVRLTRLASGLPAGADIEHADELTLSRAFAGRRPMTA